MLSASLCLILNHESPRVWARVSASRLRWFGVGEGVQVVLRGLDLGLTMRSPTEGTADAAGEQPGSVGLAEVMDYSAIQVERCLLGSLEGV